MTYSKDDIRRLREAYAAVSRLESVRRYARGSEHRVINDAIARWKTTIAFIKERGE